jgi:hypothetical protein
LKIKNPAQVRERLAAWFREHGRDLPWRRTRDPYAILVSEFMLQQTQVATVIPYYERWLARFPNFATLARAKEAEVLAVWQGLGYYSRARNLHRRRTADRCEHGGELPRDPATLARLPGVGRYTAERWRASPSIFRSRRSTETSRACSRGFWICTRRSTRSPVRVCSGGLRRRCCQRRVAVFTTPR